MNARIEAQDRPSLLLIDDDPLIAESLRFVLSEDYDVTVAVTRAEAKSILETEDLHPELALVDLGLPPHTHKPDEGLALISELPAFNPQIKILVLSGQDDEGNVKQALANGAVDFIAKPCDVALLKARLTHQLKINRAEETEQSNERLCGMVGSGQQMSLLRAQIEQLSDLPFPLLIEGESGTGKELVAECLHAFSQRADLPFLTLNCAAFNPELLEAQLFGHAKGAFTGATEARNGFFEEAGEGTLFLDEIGDLPIDLQSKLLRVLENGEYYRIGETVPQKAHARIIAATNSNLQDGMLTGGFREDLYHRLNVLSLHVPPLRDRGKDRLQLLTHFLSMYSTAVSPFSLNDQAEALWLEYDFPGNARELRNIVIRLAAKYPGQEIGRDELLPELQQGLRVGSAQATENQSLDFAHDLLSGEFNLDESLANIEQAYIEQAVKLSHDNFSKAAKMLGVNRTTLYSRMNKYGQDEEF